MKGFVIDKFGLENLTFRDVEESGDGIRVKITMAAINPLDYNLVNGKVVYGVAPMPHIAGSEVIGEVVDDGISLRKGQRVMVYNRIFDSTCGMCVSGNEHLCFHGGLWGVGTNGGFQEYVRVPEKNLIRIPDHMTDIQAVSIPIAALTAYHAIKRSNAHAGEKILFYGAAGNTGILGMQIANIMGLDVYGVSNNDMAKGYGAVKIFRRDEIPEGFTSGIIINPMGSEVFQDSLTHLSRGGRLVTFGILTGRNSEIDIANIYTSEKSIIGSTGGTRKDLEEILEIMKNHQIRVPVDSTFRFEELVTALKRHADKHSGRIIVKY